jgi:hypothetical protein
MPAMSALFQQEHPFGGVAPAAPQPGYITILFAHLVLKAPRMQLPWTIMRLQAG